MMLIILSFIIMYFGVRFFLFSIGDEKKIDPKNKRMYKLSGLILFFLGLVLLIYYCILQVLF